MVVLGALVDGVACIVGGVVGALLKQKVSKPLGDFLMKAVALCLILIGIQGMVQAHNTFIITLEVILGAILGYWIDLDKRIRVMGDAIQEQCKKRLGHNCFFANISEGFVSATLVICVGSMGIVGSLNAGLMSDHSLLFTKGLVDFVINLLLSATMGVGVALSGVVAMIYEALLSVGAHSLSTILTTSVISDMMVTGSLLLFALGLDMMNICKMKVANLIPACFMPIIVLGVMALLHL